MAKIFDDTKVKTKDNLSKVSVKLGNKDFFTEDCPISKEDFAAFNTYKRDIVRSYIDGAKELIKGDVTQAVITVKTPLPFTDTKGISDETTVIRVNTKAEIRDPKAGTVRTGTTVRVVTKLPKGAYADNCKALIDSFN